MVSWIFQRSLDLLTCEVDFDRNRAAYDVCVVAHGEVSSSVVQSFGSVTEALERHAALASGLRQSGWHIAGYGARN